MRCCSIKFCSVFVPVVLACVAYYLYEPVPEPLRNKWDTQIMYGIVKLIGIYSTTYEKLGFGTKLNGTRNAMEKIIVPFKDENITVTEINFGNVPVTIFRPKTAKDVSPAVVYFHGGGWIYMSSALLAGTISDVAKWLNVVVVSVDYRLAPENPFPAPFDDCVTATVHVLLNGHKFGIDVNNVGIAGDSAGGNLAAAVGLRLAEEKQAKIPKLKFQLLLYPVLQAWDLRTSSYIYHSTPTLSPSMISEMFLHFLGIEPTNQNVQAFMTNNHVTPSLKKSVFASYIDQNLIPPKFRRTVPHIPENVNKTFAKSLEALIINQYAFPLMAKDVSKVAPAFILTVQHDILRDDGLMYAERLRRAGVDVQHYHVSDALHGCLFRGSKDPPNAISVEILDQLAAYAKRYFT